MADNFIYTTLIPQFNNTGVPIEANIGTFTRFTKSLFLELRRDIDFLGELRGMTGSNWTANKYNWTKGTAIALELGHQIWMSYIKDCRTACEELYTDAGLGAPSWTIATVNLTSLYDNTDAVIPGNESSYTKWRLSIITDIRTALIAVRLAEAYYVDSVDGNDTTGDGSQGNPWQTWNKGITQLNSTGGILYFEVGDYICDKALTKNDTSLQGCDLGEVTLKYDDLAYPIKGNGVAIDKMVFLQPSDSTDSSAAWFDTADNLSVTFSVFRTELDASNAAAMLIRSSTPVTFNHCTFTGVNNTANRGANLLRLFGTMDATFNNCIFGHCNEGVKIENYNVTFNSCGFYDNDDDVAGSPAATYNDTWHDGDASTKNPYILDWSYPLLAVKYETTNEFIGSGTDGKDRGAYHNVYNYIALAATESLSCNDSIIDTTQATISEDLVVQSWDNNNDLTEENMNLTVKMLLGGLFRCDVDADILYIDANELANMKYEDGNNNLINFESHITDNYNGASVDVELEGQTGNHKLYVTVAVPGTDYTRLAWWEGYKANNTGAGTTTAFVDGFLDCRTNDEWGKGYIKSLSGTPTQTNRFQMDVTLKIRALREADNVWSELVTLSKTYDFSQFDSTVYFCADNPRAVDDEYADHANYYANDYHEEFAGSMLEYQNPAGTLWSLDPRRYIYNPITKSNLLMHGRISVDSVIIPPSWLGDPGSWLNVRNSWIFHRQIDSIHELGELHIPFFTLFACIGCNYGDWSDGHVFDDISAQVADQGARTVTAPLLANDTSKYHYLFSFFSLEGDCQIHNSYPELHIRLSSGGENIVTGFHTGKLRIIDNNDFDFATESSGSPCFDTDFWFRSKDNVLIPGTVYRQVLGVYKEWHINTNQVGDKSFGDVSFRLSNPDSGNIWSESW